MLLQGNLALQIVEFGVVQGYLERAALVALMVGSVFLLPTLPDFIGNIFSLNQDLQYFRIYRIKKFGFCLYPENPKILQILIKNLVFEKYESSN